MNTTKIEYLTHSWNPLKMRCTPVSEGCANCWHLAMAKRLTSNPKLPNEVRAAYAGDGVLLLENELFAPLRRKKPARIGVQFMGDLFHEDVPFTHVDKVMQVIASAPQHTFLILTKYAERMFVYFNGENVLDYHPPLENLWAGITAENQRRYEERLPWLLQVPAPVRFVSLEPLLGLIDLSEHLMCKFYAGPLVEPRRGTIGGKPMPAARLHPRLDWVVIGCESGAQRRQTAPDWILSIVNQCKEANVPVFIKQVSIMGKVSHSPADWPRCIRIREYPDVKDE